MASQKTKGRKGGKKWLILPISIGVVVLLIVAAILFMVGHQGIFGGSSARTSGSTLSPLEQLTANAESTAADKGYAAAQQDLDKQASSAPSNNSNSSAGTVSKADVYLEQSSLASSLAGNNDYKAALAYALKAESVSPSVQTAGAVASSYFLLKDNLNAVKYYNLELSRMDDAYKTANPDDYGQIKSIVDQLQGQQ